MKFWLKSGDVVCHRRCGVEGEQWEAGTVPCGRLDGVDQQ
jgi:hypothetical protein